MICTATSAFAFLDRALNRATIFGGDDASAANAFRTTRINDLMGLRGSCGLPSSNIENKEDFRIEAAVFFDPLVSVDSCFTNTRRQIGLRNGELNA